MSEKITIFDKNNKEITDRDILRINEKAYRVYYCDECKGLKASSINGDGEQLFLPDQKRKEIIIYLEDAQIIDRL